MMPYYAVPNYPHGYAGQPQQGGEPLPVCSKQMVPYYAP